MAATLQKRHVHSALFLVSRALVVLALAAPWGPLRAVVSAVLAACALQQAVHYARRRRVVDERRFSSRASQRRINQSTGPVGKALAAVEVYLWQARTHPSPVNLLHWAEDALKSMLMSEAIKLRNACHMRLEFFWCYVHNALVMRGVKRDQATRLMQTVSEMRHAVLVRLLGERRLSSPKYVVLSKSPSLVVWLLWVVGGRSALSCLHDDPRERAYHMDSFAEHVVRLRQSDSRSLYRPRAFGHDMREHFEKGISRRIHIDELDDAARMTHNILHDEASNLARGSGRDDGEDGEDGEDGVIDHSCVYCISYRHLEDKGEEAHAIAVALHVAGEITWAKGDGHFRVWLDKVARQCADRPAENWAFHGLLPYAYYPVIAARNMKGDEGERMWLLAEERLGYGNMGLFWADVQAMRVSMMAGVSSGPEHALRIYLRFLKTEEGHGERTYHHEDKQRFRELAGRHGHTDDEQGMYEGLFSRPGAAEAGDREPWWPSVLAVESYACLRVERRRVEEITFARTAGVAFDGYREWFRHKDDRVFPAGGARASTSYEARWSYQAERASAHEVRARGGALVALVFRGTSGFLPRAACVCVAGEPPRGARRAWKADACYRVQLRYETPPRDDAFVAEIVRHFGWAADDELRVTQVAPDDIQFV